MELVGWLLVLGEQHDGVLEGEQDAGVDVEREMQVERPAATLLGVQVDLPDLAQRVGLDEVPLVVHVEPVVDGMILQVGDVAGDVDGSHSWGSLMGPGGQAVRGLGATTADRVRLPWTMPACSRCSTTPSPRCAAALDALEDWGPTGEKPGQYRLDLAADAAALPVLHGAGLAVLSEESGATGEGNSGLLAVIDPVDGSTNAHRGVPFYATSICVLDDAGPRVGLVTSQATGERYAAVRGGGAEKDGRRMQPSGCEELSGAIVGISGFPGHHPGWAQYRALGAASLECCAVADGVLDAYMVVGPQHPLRLGLSRRAADLPRGGCGGGEREGRDLVVRDASSRRPIVAATLVSSRPDSQMRAACE